MQTYTARWDDKDKIIFKNVPREELPDHIRLLPDFDAVQCMSPFGKTFTIIKD